MVINTYCGKHGNSKYRNIIDITSEIWYNNYSRHTEPPGSVEWEIYELKGKPQGSDIG